MKRTLDIVFSLLGIIFLMPIGLVVAVGIVLTSRGPIVFRQKRLGRDGQFFRICKFRTMAISGTGEACRVTEAGNCRITTVGRWLRRTKLDELPQLYNVLIGEMSFVGPRPEVAEFANLFPQQYERILKVRPGITHPATLMFRREEDILAAAHDPCQHYIDNVMPVKLAAYEESLEASLAQDIQTIVQTILPQLGEEPFSPEHFAPVGVSSAPSMDAPVVANIPAGVIATSPDNYTPAHSTRAKSPRSEPQLIA